MVGKWVDLTLGPREGRRSFNARAKDFLPGVGPDQSSDSDLELLPEAAGSDRCAVYASR